MKYIINLKLIIMIKAEILEKHTLNDYQNKFDHPESSFKTKLAVLNTVNQSHYFNKKERFLFINKNCGQLPNMVTDFNQMVDLFLFFNLCGCQKIWSIITAVRAIKIWLKGKDIDEITLNYRADLVEVFSPIISAGAIEIMVADDISKKLRS